MPRGFGDRSFDTAAQMRGSTLTGLTEPVGADVIRWGVKLQLGGTAGALRGELGYSGQYQKNATTRRFSAGLRMAL